MMRPIMDVCERCNDDVWGKTEGGLCEDCRRKKQWMVDETLT